MYRIYVKYPENKRWYAISGGGITKNLIYAEMWDSQENADKACVSLTNNNPDMLFQVRRA